MTNLPILVYYSKSGYFLHLDCCFLDRNVKEITEVNLLNGIKFCWSLRFGLASHYLLNPTFPTPHARAKEKLIITCHTQKTSANYFYFVNKVIFPINLLSHPVKKIKAKKTTMIGGPITNHTHNKVAKR